MLIYFNISFVITQLTHIISNFIAKNTFMSNVKITIFGCFEHIFKKILSLQKFNPLCEFTCNFIYNMQNVSICDKILKQID